jgi:hypothetical protein
VTQTTVTQRGSEQSADKTAIRSFHVDVPAAELTELRRRIKATKWPERETVTDGSQGCSSRRFRNSRVIGGQITIGASARRN